MRRAFRLPTLSDGEDDATPRIFLEGYLLLCGAGAAVDLRCSTLNCDLAPMNPPIGKTMHQMRLMHFKRQDGLCWLCDEPLDLFLPVHAYGGCSWEHVIPKCGGGSKGWGNVVLTHRECNRARGEQMIWRLRRPRPGAPTKRPNADREQRRFEHNILNRFLRPLMKRATST